MRIALALALALLLPATAPAATKFRGVVAVEELAQVTGAIDARLSLPRAWGPFEREVEKGTARTRVRVGGCRLSLLFVLRLRVGDEGLTTDHVRFRLFGTAGTIVAGSRDDAAWRVVRRPSASVEALYAITDRGSWTDLEPETRVFREIFVHVRPLRGKCSGAAVRVGRQVGRVLAGATTRAREISDY